jgi:hypothetical protein
MKSLESKEFACSRLYFKRYANWMSNTLRRAYSVSRIEISQKNLLAPPRARRPARTDRPLVPARADRPLACATPAHPHPHPTVARPPRVAGRSPAPSSDVRSSPSTTRAPACPHPLISDVRSFQSAAPVRTGRIFSPSMPGHRSSPPVACTPRRPSAPASCLIWSSICGVGARFRAI